MNFSTIAENWQQISLAISGIIAFFAGRKTKKNAEQSGELQNIEKVREIEKALLEDMEEQIKKLIDTNNILEAIIEKQSKKIRYYEKKYGHVDLDAKK